LSVSLSVCCLTDAPGARIRAIMEPLREVASAPSFLHHSPRWDEPHRRHERFEGAYAVHHWALSWLKAEEAARSKPAQ
jgi:hypothetical protein